MRCEFVCFLNTFDLKSRVCLDSDWAPFCLFSCSCLLNPPK